MECKIWDPRQVCVHKVWMMANKINASRSAMIMQRIMMAMMDLSQELGHYIICGILNSATESLLETGSKTNEARHKIMDGWCLRVHTVCSWAPKVIVHIHICRPVSSRKTVAGIIWRIYAVICARTHSLVFWKPIKVIISSPNGFFRLEGPGINKKWI